MKIIEYLILIMIVFFTYQAFAMTVNTGDGYYTYNGQVIAYYHLKPGTYPDSDVNYVETVGSPIVPINDIQSCRYYQIHNPLTNMQCS